MASAAGACKEVYYPHDWKLLRTITDRFHVFYCTKCLEFKTVRES